MEKTKKDDLKTYVMLMKHGVNVKLTMALMVLFIFVGIIIELGVVFMDTSGRLMVDFGALILLCAAMYPMQLLMSANLSTMIQASAYRKRLHTAAPVLLCLGCNLAVLAAILLIRGLGVWAMPHRAAEIMRGLADVGLLVLGIDILASVLYKFFYLSMAIYVVLCSSLGFTTGYRQVLAERMDIVRRWLGMSAPAAIAFCLAMVFLGAAVQYLLNRAVYKHPLSRAAFGNNTAKKLV